MSGLDVAIAGAGAAVAVYFNPPDMEKLLETMTMGGRSPQFWILQALFLGMILFLYWVTNLAYDRFIERPFGVVVGWTFDGAEAVLRPTGRAIVRFGTWLHGSPLGAALRRWLPDLTWPALERLACAITLVALAVQHVQLARRAADDGHGVHRAELPQLAAGMLHWRWAGACARPADGVLSHHLAALPLRLGWDADDWDDAARWKFANATAPPRTCGGGPARW